MSGYKKAIRNNIACFPLIEKALIQCGWLTKAIDLIYNTYLKHLCDNQSKNVALKNVFLSYGSNEVELFTRIFLYKKANITYDEVTYQQLLIVRKWIQYYTYQYQ